MKTKNTLSEIEIKIITALIAKSEGDAKRDDGSVWHTVFIDNVDKEKLGITKRQWAGYIASITKKGYYEKLADDYNPSAFGLVKELTKGVKDQKSPMNKRMSERKDALKDLNNHLKETGEVIKSYYAPKEKKIKGKTVFEFVDFLEQTLIPDLKESGSTCTAEDFESAVKWIKHLVAKASNK